MSEERDKLQLPLDDPDLEPLQRLLEGAPSEFRGIREDIYKAWRMANDNENNKKLALNLIRQVLEFVVVEASPRVSAERTRVNWLAPTVRRLFDEGHFPAHLKRSVYIVIELGNLGSHYGSEPATQDDVKKALVNLSPILKWHFAGTRSGIDPVPPRTRESVSGGGGAPWVMRVEIAGELFAGPVNVTADAWTSVQKTPGEWVFRAGEVGRLKVDPDVSENALAGLARLRGLPGFQSLDMSHCSGVTDASMAHLRGLTSLRSLDLSLNPLTDEGLASLAGLRELRSLNLSECRQVKGPGLEHLWKCPKLRALDLVDSCVICEGLMYLRGFANLQSLRIGHNHDMAIGIVCGDLPLWKDQAHVFLSGGRGLKCLRGLDSLQELLVVSGIGFKPEELTHLEGLVNLRSLNLFDVYGDDGFLLPMPSLPNLRSFVPPRTIRNPGLACLRAMPKLQELDLGYRDQLHEDDGLACVGELPDLHTLYLNDVEWPLAVPLERLTNLRELHLSRCYCFEDEDLACLCGLTKLEYLDLDSTLVSGEGLSFLRSLEKLRHLYLSKTCVTDAGLAHLHPLDGLRILGLWDCRVTAAGLDTLRAALPNCRILT